MGFEEIGRGDTAVVYRAQEISTGKTWAIKVYKENSTNLESIKNEICMLQQLNHTKILQLREWFEKPTPALVFEFISGLDILEGITSSNIGTFDENTCRDLVRQICEALMFLHSKQIVHLDICPQNVILQTQTNKI